MGALRSTLVNSVAGAFWLPRGLRTRLYRLGGVAVGRGALILHGQAIRRGRLSFGDRCFVNARCHFDPGSAEIRIEDDVALGPNVVLAASTHEVGPATARAGRNVSRPIVVGRGSWLGAGVVVLPGVRIAPGCVVGAGSVVTRDVEPDALAIARGLQQSRPGWATRFRAAMTSKKKAG